MFKKFKTVSTGAVRSCLKSSKDNSFGDAYQDFDPKDYFYLPNTGKCRLCLLAAEDNGCNNEICSNSEMNFY